jgi:hypothetical protein
MEDSGGVRVPIRNTEEPMFTPVIQNHLLTVIVSALDFLGFLRVHLLSVSLGGGVQKEGIQNDGIRLISSWGNHATAVCYVKDKTPENKTPERTVTACLRFKTLQSNSTTRTNRYDSPQGVVQLVFPKLVEKVREIMVLGNVPLDVNNWTNWDNTILTSVLHELNNNGIVAGRVALEHKLTLSFERIRKLTLEGDTTKSNELREIRIRYCDLLLDLLRDDLLQNYGGNVQQGLLGTINFGNKNDEYTTHNGKPVTDLALKQAVYNVLFLVHIQIGGRIYTVHMDINRDAVKAFLKSPNDERRQNGENEFQSVSYWVGGVLEFIHTNKAAFVECVSAALGAFSGRTPGVGAVEAEQHKTVVLRELNKFGAGAGAAGAGAAGADVQLQHDAFILSCKSVTLIRESSIATPVPINDNTVGTDHDGRPFSSFKETDFAGSKITGVSFDVYCDDDLLNIGGNEHCCHFPKYDLRPIDRIIRTEVGVFDDSQTRAEYSGTTPESQEIQDEVIKSYRDDLFEFRAAEVAEARKGEAEAEALGAGPAIMLADALKTAVKASSPEEETTAKASLLGLLQNPTFVAKKVVGYICDSYNFWSNPLRAIRRAGSSLLHDKGLDIQLLDLVAYALSNDVGMAERITSIITEIRASDHFPAFEPINQGIIMLFAAGGAGGAGDGMNGGGRSRRRSLQKKTRRISSIRQRTLKKKNISRKYSRYSIRSRRCYSRKNGRQ